MFESPFNKPQPSSIFSNPLQYQYNTPEKLDELYQNLELLKNKEGIQNAQRRTVFTDIATEWKDISDDERRFIESSKEYAELSQKYQNEFSVFLMEYLGDDFLKSKYGKTPEQMLALIRKKKEEYKDKFAQNINEIRDQNNALAIRNEELARANIDLQAKLAEISKHIGGLKNGN